MLSKFLVKFFDSKSKASDGVVDIANLSKAEQAKHYISELQAIKGKPFSLVKATSITITTTDSDIISNIERLEQYIELFKAPGSPPSAKFYADYHTVSLNKYFTDINDYYIPASVLVKYLQTADTLLVQLQRIEGIDNRNYKYAQRMLSKSIDGMISVCKAVLAARD